MKKVKLGSVVRDKVTGFAGTVTAKVEYLNGCNQFCVTPQMGADNSKMPVGEYIDAQQLEVVDKEALKITQKETGGPQRGCPKH